MHQIAVIVFNGPSSTKWHGIKLPSPVFGCNFAFRDFAVDYLYAVDRIAVHNIRLENPRCECWTKQSNLNLELPPNWKHAPTPGIDSGSFALEQAMMLYPEHTKLVIGADGILKLNSNTVYKYHWRTSQPGHFSHLRHRKTVKELLEKYQQTVLFVSEHEDTDLETIKYADALGKVHMALDGK